MKDEIKYLKSQIQEQYGFESIIGTSESIRETIRMASRLAPTDESVLITGASGTGKELFARAIHFASPRQNHRFIAVNCGALPEHLIESELFGHKKGAFTGATSDKVGLIQEAHRGTIFLDEIAELPQQLQVKLLRFLQDHKIRAVGGLKESQVDVRVVAATNKVLEDEVAEERFREDLYYRLRVLELRIPPLKERRDDIPVLVRFFLEKFAKRSGRDAFEVPPKVMARLQEYDWPGNVREIENLAKHLVIMCEDNEVRLDDLPPYLQDSPKRQTGGFLGTGESYSEIRSRVLEDFNQSILTEALELEDWNISRAAERLGTAKSNVIRLMKRFDLSKKEKE
ncbi:MAG: sigma-54 dependent transcriptional regulator [Deltaproteobacteria bacterium]|nr:sigma-54 dependent transcriptional regulator [Deltaproteobacteria bacterium]